MKKITNPFVQASKTGQYNCFGCSPSNDHGLQMEFFLDGDELVAKWNPKKTYEGWKGVVHGGIQATIMDEAAAWLVFVKLKTSGVTTTLNITYNKPAFISKGEITARARLLSTDKLMARIECLLLDGENEICARAEAIYYCYSEKIAQIKYNYPGVDAFFSEENK